MTTLADRVMEKLLPCKKCGNKTPEARFYRYEGFRADEEFRVDIFCKSCHFSTTGSSPYASNLAFGAACKEWNRRDEG